MLKLLFISLISVMASATYSQDTSAARYIDSLIEDSLPYTYVATKSDTTQIVNIDGTEETQPVKISKYVSKGEKWKNIILEVTNNSLVRQEAFFIDDKLIRFRYKGYDTSGFLKRNFDIYYKNDVMVHMVYVKDSLGGIPSEEAYLEIAYLMLKNRY